jgi:hypothetical protein
MQQPYKAQRASVKQREQFEQRVNTIANYIKLGTLLLLIVAFVIVIDSPGYQNAISALSS